MANPLTRQMERTTDLIYRGLEGRQARDERAKAAERQAKLDAERAEEREYRRGREAKLDEARAPALEIAKRKSQAEIDAQDDPVTLARLAPNPELMEWATWTPQKGKGDPKQGEQKAFYQKFGDMFGSVLDTKKGSPTEGQYVNRKTGKPLTGKDVDSRQEEVLALWIANRGHGRSFRAGHERNDKDLMMGKIDEATHAKRKSEIQFKSNSPVNRLNVLNDEITFLKKFNTAEAKAGLAKKEKRRDALLATIKKGTPKGGKWKYNSDTGNYYNEETLEIRPARVGKKLDPKMKDTVKIGNKLWSNKELRNTYNDIHMSQLGITPATLQRMEDSGNKDQIKRAQDIRAKLAGMTPFDEWVGKQISQGKVYMEPHSVVEDKRMMNLGYKNRPGTGRTSYKNLYTKTE